MKSDIWAIAEVVFASVLWGLGFVATIWSLRSFGPFTVTFVRFAGTLLFGFIAAGLVPVWRRKLRRQFQWKQMRNAVVPGLLLSCTLLFQAWGLRYTTATKSGFITCLYVIMVPMIEPLVLRRRPSPAVFVFAFLALIGTAMIVNLQWSGFNFGDLLTLICAGFATAQIVWLGVASHTTDSPFFFNTAQSLWGGLLALPFAFTFEKFPRHIVPVAAMGLLILLFGSTIVAFFLQVRAQKRLSPSLASLLFLLESPFAAIFACWLLRESLTAMQEAGAALIFISALGAIYFDGLARKTLMKGPELENPRGSIV